MATWTITESDAGIKSMTYRNSITGQKQFLGVLNHGVTENQIVDWVVEQRANLGDIIVLPRAGAIPILLNPGSA